MAARLESESGGIRVRRSFGKQAKFDAHPRTEPLPDMMLRLIGEHTHTLIESGPALRRRFIDHNLFHVEQSARQVEHNYRTALTQRNAALRARTNDLTHWDSLLSHHATTLNSLRLRWIAGFEKQFSELCATFPLLQNATFRLHAGWDSRKPLYEELRRTRTSDLEKGYTGLGPHRGDLCVQLDNRRYFGSRGQNKIFGIVAQCAADRLSSASRNTTSLWLIDDLPSELAPEMTEASLNLISTRGGQCLYTAHNLQQIPKASEAVVFHVEHGIIRQL